MGLFGRSKGGDGKRAAGAPAAEAPVRDENAASPRVGVVSSVLAAPGEGDGPSLFDQVVERRFGPEAGSRREATPPGDRRDAEAAIEVEVETMDEDDGGLLEATTESPSLEIDAMAHIGTATTIVGHLSADEDLEIQGRIEGSVRVARHRLRIGREAAIEASVEARIVEVEGRVVGDVVAEERVEIRAGGVVRGDVRAPRMVIDDGGILVGGLDMSAALPAESASDVAPPEPAEASGDGMPDKPKLIKVDPADAAAAERSGDGSA